MTLDGIMHHNVTLMMFLALHKSCSIKMVTWAIDQAHTQAAKSGTLMAAKCDIPDAA